MQSLISKNVDLGPPLFLSSWRKVAIGTWKTVGDPSVYGCLEIDVSAALAYIEKLRQKTGLRITLSHFTGMTFAKVLKENPSINCVLRFGRLYPRKNIDIFFQVASDTTGEDLSGMTVRNADQKTITKIAQEIEARVNLIKQKKDTSFTKMKNLMGGLPGWASSFILGFAGFFMYTLNLWSPLLGSPKDAFGSMMLTNIGSLGLDMAFAPLVPYSRIPLLIALGSTYDAVVARDGKAHITKMIRICATFDHRLIDGVKASHMVKATKRIFANPEVELGSI
ncbi:MAG: 2-oxo acid dehydrogenase subunit E2 [Bdellovibrio sp.]|nr:2-oxo acid dehydrogenase subunit E2 [Bdellovibrio sp.]